MKLNYYKKCCAAGYISDIYQYDNYAWSYLDEKKTEKDLKKFLYKAPDLGLNFLTVILDDEQYIVVGKIFRKYGFKLIKKFNGNDSPVLYHMAKEIQ